MSRAHVELPSELERRAKSVARSAGITLQALIETAVAEKLAAAKTARSMPCRLSRAARGRAIELLAKAPNVPPMKGDELPADLAVKLEKRWSNFKRRSFRRM